MDSGDGGRAEGGGEQRCGGGQRGALGLWESTEGVRGEERVSTGVSLSAGVGGHPQFDSEITHGALFLFSQWLHMWWHQVRGLWRI